MQGFLIFTSGRGGRGFGRPEAGENIVGVRDDKMCVSVCMCVCLSLLSLSSSAKPVKRVEARFLLLPPLCPARYCRDEYLSPVVSAAAAAVVGCTERNVPPDGSFVSFHRFVKLPVVSAAVSAEAEAKLIEQSVLPYRNWAGRTSRVGCNAPYNTIVQPQLSFTTGRQATLQVAPRLSAHFQGIRQGMGRGGRPGHSESRRSNGNRSNGLAYMSRPRRWPPSGLPALRRMPHANTR